MTETLTEKSEKTKATKQQALVSSWKKWSKRSKEKILGLDIGSSAVKLIQLRKDEDQYVVTAAVMVEIPSITSDNDDDDRDTNIANTICNCLHPANVQTQLAVCGVSGPEVAVRYFNFPSLPAEEVEGAVLLEAAQVCPFNIDDSAVDYRLISSEQDNISGMLVAATNRIIETKKRLTEKASLSCVMIDVDGLALLNCFTEIEKPTTSETVAILNVGSDATLAIANDKNLPFVRDIAYAGNHIIEKIAAENNVSKKIVARALINKEKAENLQFEISSNLAEACSKLITDVNETLRYYTAQEKTEVGKILVCGGFAMIDGFVQLLNQKLQGDVVLWNPFEKIKCEASTLCAKMLAEKGPALAIAAGLAMRSI